MATKAMAAFEELDKKHPGIDTVYSLEEIRSRNNINILLPYNGSDGEDPEGLDQYEYVTINGKTTQIHKGEVVGVSWEIYEALKHSEAYKKQKILA